LGDEQKVRAVANANGANRVALIVPCHRVVGANQDLTGYRWGLERKEALLDHERRQKRLF
jgi:O-6-methylguanine DNA methyltransferase